MADHWMDSDHNIETVSWKGFDDTGFNPSFAGSSGNQGSPGKRLE